MLSNIAVYNFLKCLKHIKLYIVENKSQKFNKRNRQVFAPTTNQVLNTVPITFNSNGFSQHISIVNSNSTVLYSITNSC